VEFENRSADFAGLAVQGPRSAQLFDAFFGGQYSRPARNEILSVEIDGFCYYIARTGYTGEDGFEVYAAADKAEGLWDKIL
jgi:aminomethyltransferase